jgi:hypothetical protein
MNNPYRQKHIFWGPHAPLATLVGAGFIIMASSRTAFALIALGALVWVYALTALIFRIPAPALPERGKNFILVSVSAFSGGLFHLMLCLISPLLAVETALPVILAPVCCIASGMLPRLESLSTEDTLLRALSEALVMGFLTLIMAVIREPLGFGTFSLPGGPGGIIELFGKGENSFVPVHIISSSAGALLLFGYGLAVFRREKGRQFRKDTDGTAGEEL